MCLLQACIHHGADADETCVDCLKSKANIGRPKGLRDDLVFLLEEDLSHINLCSLHCKMHNTEQLLGSLGLSAYRVGCLHLLNAALSSYGAESQQDFSCIKVKEKPGQQTGIESQSKHQSGIIFWRNRKTDPKEHRQYCQYWTSP